MRNGLTSLLILIVTGLAVQSRASVLCMTRGGTLKVRDQCRAREIPADVAALGLMRGLLVKDSNGVTVGVFAGSATDPVAPGNVLRNVGGKLVPLTVFGTPDGTGSVLAGSRSDLWFPTPDCSGSIAYIEPRTALRPEAVLVNSTLYYESGPPTTVTVQGYRTVAPVLSD